LNSASSEDKHVPEIERYIRTLKERARAAYNTVPVKKMPGLMISELVHASNYWLNMFPAHDGVSPTQSPRQIMTGQHSDYNLHGQLQFGEYAQVHESHDNTMSTRTTGAIALRPTGNIQGGYYFMSLSSGKRLNRYAWTALPMPGEVIERVHKLAQRNPAGGKIAFGWRDGPQLWMTLMMMMTSMMKIMTLSMPQVPMLTSDDDGSSGTNDNDNSAGASNMTIQTLCDGSVVGSLDGGRFGGASY
jgi:hypothetical protein